MVHGSQPKFTIPECVEDINRAIRYIRAHADEFKIDPEPHRHHRRFGRRAPVADARLCRRRGRSQGEGPGRSRQSRVQAVACFFPPTDFLNYGKPGMKSLGIEPNHQFKPPFDFRSADPSDQVVHAGRHGNARKICRDMSPVLPRHRGRRAHADHPRRRRRAGALQQSELICEKFKEAGVPCELVVKKGAGHGWPTIFEDFKTIADWFDKYLAARRPCKQPQACATSGRAGLTTSRMKSTRDSAYAKPAA